MDNSLACSSCRNSKSDTKMTNDLNPDLKIALRTGDTSQKRRGNQKRKPSFGLVTTPESLHLLLSTKDHKKTLRISK